MNESNPYPKDYQYADEHWELALEKIEAHERKTFWKKRAGVSLLGLALVSSLLFWNLHECTCEGQLMSATQEQMTSDAQSTTQNDAATIQEIEPSSLQVDTGSKPTNEGVDRSDKQESTSLRKITTLSNENAHEIGSAQIQVESRELLIGSTKAEVTQANESTGQAIPSPGTAVQVFMSPEFDGQSSNTDEQASIVHDAEDNNVTPSVYMVSNDNTSTITETSILAAMPRNKPLSTDSSPELHSEMRPLPPIKDSHYLPRNFLVLGAGLTITQDYAVTDNKRIRDAEFTAGYEHQLNENWRLGAGLRYLEVSNSGINYLSQQTSYGYQSEIISTTVKAEKLTYIGIPIHLSHTLRPRLEIQAGIGVDFLLQSYNRITATRDAGEYGQQVVKDETIKGIIDGHREFSSYGKLGINYWLFDKWSLGLSYQQGLTDMSIDNILSNSQRDPNTRTAITFKRLLK